MPYAGLLHPEPLPLQQDAADPYLHRTHSNTAQAQSLWVSGSWCAQDALYALRESISQSCVSSGSSVVGLVVTSSKRAYAMSRAAAPRAPAPEEHSFGSVSVGSLGPGALGLFEPSEHLYWV